MELQPAYIPSHPLCSQAKPESTAEEQVKQPSSPCVDPLAGEKGLTEDHQPSAESSTDSSEDSHPKPSSPDKFSGSPLCTTSGANSQSHSSATPSPTSQGQVVSGSANGSQLPSRPRGRGSTSSSTRPQQRARLPSATPRFSQPALRSLVPTPYYIIPNQALPPDQSPSGTIDPVQPTSKGPSEPEDSIPRTTKPCQKQWEKQPSNGTSLPQVTAPCHSASSESSTELACNWPHYRQRMRCPCHCWLLKHLTY